MKKLCVLKWMGMCVCFIYLNQLRQLTMATTTTKWKKGDKKREKNRNKKPFSIHIQAFNKSSYLFTIKLKYFSNIYILVAAYLH